MMVEIVFDTDVIPARMLQADVAVEAAISQRLVNRTDMLTWLQASQTRACSPIPGQPGGLGNCAAVWIEQAASPLSAEYALAQPVEYSQSDTIKGVSAKLTVCRKTSSSTVPSNALEAHLWSASCA